MKFRHRFDGSRNITHFLQLAMQNELYALVRIGPYICAEWENGGAPWWLLKYKDIKMRTSDKRFLDAVKRWFDVLLPILKPNLRKNGGPILMLQLENEYGSFDGGCDRNYTIFLRDLARRHFGDDVVLYTSNILMFLDAVKRWFDVLLPILKPNLRKNGGPILMLQLENEYGSFDGADGGDDFYLKCGTIPGVYATVDFGPASSEAIDHCFASQRQYEPHGPLVNSEFYPGWFLTWSQKERGDQPVHNVINGSKYMFEKGANFNYYMFHGGTNFAFWNGGATKTAITTSYDYFAPLSEAADITDKYLAIRDWIKTIENWPNPPKSIPKNNPKSAYGVVKMHKIGSLVSDDILELITNRRPILSHYPLSFEELQHPFGFVAYRSKLMVPGGNLTISVIKDYGYVFVGQDYQGMLVDSFEEYEKRWILVKGHGMLVDSFEEYEKRWILVKGHGILSNVTINGTIMVDWKHYPISSPHQYDQEERQLSAYGTPGLYVGHFIARLQQDTFISPQGWGKGQIFINGFNVGRYWPNVGPQVTLYVPSPIIRKRNTVMIIELIGASKCTSPKCAIEFIDHPIFNFTSISLMNNFHRHIHIENL
uniref:Beta-galactosidase n=1 Tax=Ascaris lumbricoides TaxID=6252 RepID=A0A0M3IL12_ASCLU